MQQSDFDSFVDILQVVGEQYGKKLSDGVIALYWQGLQDIEFAGVKDALGKHLRNPDTGQFMPKIADIRRMLEGSTQDAALMAWAKVDKAVREVGPYVDVVFDDPLIHRVLHEIGGWIALGIKTQDEWPFVAREFENRYRAYKTRNEHPDYLPVMVGIAGAQNTREGFRVAPPTLIGNVDIAKRVMLGGTNIPMLGIHKLGEKELLALESRSEAA